MKKPRTTIPQLSKVRAILQQEINSKCPICSSPDVGHFEIHHIDENRDNHQIENLLLLCPTCHSKITKKDILLSEVQRVKQNIANASTGIQLISIGIDSENCGWQQYENTPNAFKVVDYKSLFPIFNFSLINNTDKTVLLTDITISNKRLPIGLSGPDKPLPNILRPVIKYKITLPPNGETIKTTLTDEIEVPAERAFKFQIELVAESMDYFKPAYKYALNLKFGFNNDFHIDIPKIILNSEKDYDTLQHFVIN